MNELIENIKIKLTDIRKRTYDIDTEEMINDLLEQICDEEGVDIEDALSDFSKEDILRYLISIKPDNWVLVKAPNIIAESELTEVLKKFKNKYYLTEIL